MLIGCRPGIIERAKSEYEREPLIEAALTGARGSDFALMTSFA
jgi:hypothetical protein